MSIAALLSDRVFGLDHHVLVPDCIGSITKQAEQRCHCTRNDEWLDATPVNVVNTGGGVR